VQFSRVFRVRPTAANSIFRGGGAALGIQPPCFYYSFPVLGGFAPSSGQSCDAPNQLPERAHRAADRCPSLLWNNPPTPSTRSSRELNKASRLNAHVSDPSFFRARGIQLPSLLRVLIHAPLLPLLASALPRLLSPWISTRKAHLCRMRRVASPKILCLNRLSQLLFCLVLFICLTSPPPPTQAKARMKEASPPRFCRRHHFFTHAFALQIVDAVLTDATYDQASVSKCVCLQH
jgi:hypothetical protein